MGKHKRSRVKTRLLKVAGKSPPRRVPGTVKRNIILEEWAHANASHDRGR